MPESRRLSTQAEQWIESALDKHGRGEQIWFETSLLPGPQQQPILVLFLWMPGALVGTRMVGSVALEDPAAITEEGVDEVMVHFLDSMRESRSQELAKGAGSAANGQQGPSGAISGLIVPGR